MPSLRWPEDRLHFGYGEEFPSHNCPIHSEESLRLSPVLVIFVGVWSHVTDVRLSASLWKGQFNLIASWLCRKKSMKVRSWQLKTLKAKRRTSHSQQQKWNYPIAFATSCMDFIQFLLISYFVCCSWKEKQLPMHPTLRSVPREKQNRSRIGAQEDRRANSFGRKVREEREEREGHRSKDKLEEMSGRRQRRPKGTFTPYSERTSWAAVHTVGILAQQSISLLPYLLSGAVVCSGGVAWNVLALQRKIKTSGKMQEVRGDWRRAFKPREKIIAGWADEIHGFYGWF